MIGCLVLTPTEERTLNTLSHALHRPVAHVDAKGGDGAGEQDQPGES